MANKDHSYWFIAAVAIVAIIGLIIVFTHYSPYKAESTASESNPFGQASANNIHGQAVMPSDGNIVLPMECMCDEGFSCTGVYTGAYVDCSCCIDKLFD